MDSFLIFWNSIISSLNQVDQSWLLAINGQHNSFFDPFMFWISDKWIWFPMYVAIIYSIIKQKHGETIFIAVGIALTILLCDQFASGLCKPFFQRLRPCQDPVIGSMVHTVCGFKCDLYGFMSSHAANTFGLAIFTSLLFKDKYFNVMIWGWALLNCYSRMYLGVHYPGDIICGALVGLLFGWLCFMFYRFLINRMPQFRYYAHKNNSRSNIDFPTASLLPGIWTFIVTMVIITVFSANTLFTCNF